MKTFMAAVVRRCCALHECCGDSAATAASAPGQMQRLVCLGDVLRERRAVHDADLLPVCVLARTCTPTTRPDCSMRALRPKSRRPRSRQSYRPVRQGTLYLVGRGSEPAGSVGRGRARNPSRHRRAVPRPHASSAGRKRSEHHAAHAENAGDLGKALQYATDAMPCQTPSHTGPRHHPDAGQRRQRMIRGRRRTDARRPPQHWCLCDLRRTRDQWGDYDTFSPESRPMTGVSRPTTGKSRPWTGGSEMTRMSSRAMTPHTPGHLSRKDSGWTARTTGTAHTTATHTSDYRRGACTARASRKASRPRAGATRSSRPGASRRSGARRCGATRTSTSRTALY